MPGKGNLADFHLCRERKPFGQPAHLPCHIFCKQLFLPGAVKREPFSLRVCSNVPAHQAHIKPILQNPMAGEQGTLCAIFAAKHSLGDAAAGSIGRCVPACIGIERFQQILLLQKVHPFPVGSVCDSQVGQNHRLFGGQRPQIGGEIGQASFAKSRVRGGRFGVAMALCPSVGALTTRM